MNPPPPGKNLFTTPVQLENDSTGSHVATVRHSVSAQAGARILCLDDDPSVRMICERTLIKFGFHVDTGDDGLAGWMAVNDQRYDLLITDNDMPRLNGVDLIRKMRLARMTVPIVLMSGAFGRIPLDELSRLEGTIVLPKPFTPEQLLSRVDEGLHAVTNGKRVPQLDGAGPAKFESRANPG